MFVIKSYLRRILVGIVSFCLLLSFAPLSFASYTHVTWDDIPEEYVSLLSLISEYSEGDTSSEHTEDEKIIYLTFDDGPNKYTSQLLDTLDEYPEVKVTFFITRQSEKYLDQLTRAAEAGHTIGIHTNDHFFEYNYSTAVTCLVDIMKAQQLLYEYTGHCSPFIRFPGGSRTAYSYLKPSAFENTKELLYEAGMEYYDWTIAPEFRDVYPLFIAQETARLVAKSEEKGEPLIILLHDTRQNTVSALEHIIQWGFENGYTFKGLDSSTKAYHFQE